MAQTCLLRRGKSKQVPKEAELGLASATPTARRAHNPPRPPPKAPCGLYYIQADRFHADIDARRGKLKPSLQALPPDSPQTQVGLAHFSAPSATYLFCDTEFFSA